ncbi:MAG: type II toxin-antitoxin system HicB family antitoxin [Bacillota bacterium]|nr:type II toxin-antitoxin system HicB family antitoxin [Bacillota bacterium]
MKFIYPAVFRKTEEGTYTGFFPDLDSCQVTGDTLDEAMDQANEAASNWISVELEEDDCELPPVSDASDLKLEKDDIVRNILVNIRFMEGWDE